MPSRLVPLLVVLAACACPTGAAAPPPTHPTSASATASSGPIAPDRLAGGARRISIHTAKGDFWVWTKRVGENPRIKVLLLHGGPGIDHEYFEGFDSYLPAAGIEYYYYDQLGSKFSQPVPDDALASFLNIGHYVDEVEQVRQALGLDESNFYLLGQSWGGLLAIEYALAHPEHLKGLVISNMMSSIPAYNDYATKVLEPAMPPAVLAEILALEKARDYENPRYEALLMEHFYTQHILRLPLAEWPDPVLRAFDALNKKVYTPMQGPSEMGASGVLEKWDRSADLRHIRVPTLVIGAGHDTMDPKHMEWMSRQLPRGRYLFCPAGSHLAMYDDQEVYMRGLIAFLKDVDAGRL